MANRKQIEDHVLKRIKLITKSDNNVNLYKKLFKNMNNKEFDIWMNNIKTKNSRLQVIVPPDKGDTNITIENNIKIAKDTNKELFQYIVIKDDITNTSRTTANKFLILNLPLRRVKQTLDKGVSVAEDNGHIDVLTGQVKGDSAASKLSFPELQILVGMGLEKSVVELMRDRGGDLGANNTLINGLIANGRISQDIISQYSTGAESTKTLKAYLNGMHLKNTL